MTTDVMRPYRDRWFLQLNPDGVAFWDNYIHPDCTVEREQDEINWRRVWADFANWWDGPGGGGDWESQCRKIQQLVRKHSKPK